MLIQSFFTEAFLLKFVKLSLVGFSGVFVDFGTSRVLTVAYIAGRDDFRPCKFCAGAFFGVKKVLLRAESLFKDIFFC